MGKYEPDYEKIKSADGWIGKNSYVQEFFGTIFWVFLAHLANVFGLGVGFQFGLAWVIATSLFKGHFNALTTMLSMMLGGDPLDGFIRLVVQMAAGFFGYSLFYHLGYTGWKVHNDSLLSLVHWEKVYVKALLEDGSWKLDAEGNGVWVWNNEWESSFDTAGILQWVRLLFTLLVYFAAAKRLKTGKDWIDTILLLGVTFAIGGKGFVFAPNRWWFCTNGGWVAQAKGFGWDYLAYGITGFIAQYLLNLYDGDSTFDWTLPDPPQ